MHPYKRQPDLAFWARSVSENWSAGSLLSSRPLLTRSDIVASLGSCFAANLVPYLKANGFQYVEEEPRHRSFSDAPSENLSYGQFSAAYGNIYTARQFRQLLDRSLGGYRPIEDRWVLDTGEIADPVRPGLLYKARSNKEYDLLTTSHLRSVRNVFTKATAVIFTLGLTEAWMSSDDGLVFPACPGTVAGAFDPKRHRFHNFSVDEIVDDIEHIHSQLRSVNNCVRLILTVSPVPLVATATTEHVLLASTYSKSVLRVACTQVQEHNSDITYFPAYEIITGPQAPDDFFEIDKRNVSRKGVEAVMAAFLSFCDQDGAYPATEQLSDSDSTQCRMDNSPASQISRHITEVECEESASGR